jgi:transposase-like protein
VVSSGPDSDGGGPDESRAQFPDPPCPRCGATHVVKNGSKGGRPRWVCRNGGRSFGPTLGTAMDRWRVTPAEVARTLRVVMRRGSRSAAEEITGHKYETIGRWLRMAAQHAETLTEVLVHNLHLSQVEVDAFWSFVKNSSQNPASGCSILGLWTTCLGGEDRWGFRS